MDRGVIGRQPDGDSAQSDGSPRLPALGETDAPAPTDAMVPGSTAPAPSSTALVPDPAAPVPGSTAPVPDPTAPPRPARRRRPARLAVDLTLLAVVGALLVAAVAAGVGALYREFYSPSAFVERYLDTLAAGDAADALTMPGVSLDANELEAAGLPATASDALLRRAALATLADIRIVSETAHDGVTSVTASYRAGAYPGKTTFDVERDGTIGVAPTWRFAKSPLGVIDLTVLGSMSFEVNGFAIDKRQVSPAGVDADPAAPLAMLAFSPGIYSVGVDTPISSTPGVAILSDSPLKATPVAVQAVATDAFVRIVQQRVDEFLTACATQRALLPAACPFGYEVADRIVAPPTWAIAQQPVVTVKPSGGDWTIPDTEAVAHIEVDIRSLFDGSVHHVSEDVPFLVTGTITVQPDGSASITVSSPD